MSSSQNRTALVLGASGGIGGETAAALSRRGWKIRALTRHAQTEAASRNPDWEWVTGDSLDTASILKAASQVQLIVQAVNPPGYRNWNRFVLPMLESTIQAARQSNARILLPGTIYNYGPDAFPLLREDSPQHPTTKKGKIRVQLEQRLEEAAKQGVRTLIVRFGDFFGPRPGNNWFSQGLVKPGQPIRSIMYPGFPGVGHAWTFLPDAGEAFALFAERETELEKFARFHFGGYWDPDGTAITSAICRATGNPAIKIKRLPWSFMKVFSPFNETLRELGEMKTFWEHSVQLDNSKLTGFLGVEPHTKLDDAVASTLKGLGCI